MPGRAARRTLLAGMTTYHAIPGDDGTTGSGPGGRNVNSRLSMLRTSLVALSFLSLLASRPSDAQAPGWTGWARCDLLIQGPGYVNRETHTWTVNGLTPTTYGTG